MALVVSLGMPVLEAQVIDRVLAVVSGTVILMSDARAAISLGLFDAGKAADPVEAAMRWLIDRQLVLDEAGARRARRCRSGRRRPGRRPGEAAVLV